MAATVTRRAVLAGSTTTAALGVLGAGMACASAAAPSAMALRIEAHRSALTALDGVSREVRELDAFLEKSLEDRPITVAVERSGGSGTPRCLHRNRLPILDAIAADLRDAGPWMGNRYDVEAMAADLVERRARYDRNMAALEAADAAWKARRESVGADEAEERWLAASEAEVSALGALTQERARSLADAQARARYLVAADLVERIGDDGKRVRDLILSMTDEEV